MAHLRNFFYHSKMKYGGIIICYPSSRFLRRKKKLLDGNDKSSVPLKPATTDQKIDDKKSSVKSFLEPQTIIESESQSEPNTIDLTTNQTT